jgi:integrating conjugative element membrane protein (TIGR03745 family)
MKKMISKASRKLNAIKASIATLLYVAFSSAHAALPDTADPTNAAADGDYIGLWKGYAYDIGIVVGLLLGTVAFLAVTKNMIAVYNEIGTGRKTWSDMGMHGGMGVLLLVVVVFLLTEASGIIF